MKVKNDKKVTPIEKISPIKKNPDDIFKEYLAKASKKTDKDEDFKAYLDRESKKLDEQSIDLNSVREAMYGSDISRITHIASKINKDIDVKKLVEFIRKESEDKSKNKAKERDEKEI